MLNKVISTGQPKKICQLSIFKQNIELSILLLCKQGPCQIWHFVCHSSGCECCVFVVVNSMFVIDIHVQHYILSVIAMDVSADLTELGRTPVTVISSGVKSILDIQKTLEYLVTSVTLDIPSIYPHINIQLLFFFIQLYLLKIIRKKLEYLVSNVTLRYYIKMWIQTCMHIHVKSSLFR